MPLNDYDSFYIVSIDFHINDNNVIVIYTSIFIIMYYSYI